MNQKFYNNKAYVVAEVGQAHDGSLGILHSYIDAVAKTGVDAIKFQTHIAEAESSLNEPFRVKFSYEDKTRYDYWKRMGFTFEQWKGIKDHCEECRIEFLSTPFSIAAVELLEQLDMKYYKISSGDLNNYLILEKIAKTGKPIIISSGMSNFEDIDNAVKFLKQYGNEVVILQCTSQYPTSAEKVGLNVLNEIKDRYNLPVGLSDHSGTPFVGIAGATLGMSYFEFHVVFDKMMFGPDSTSSLTIEETKLLVDGIRFVEASLNNPIDKSTSNDSHMKDIFGKTLSVNKNLKKGTILTIDDLECKKPSNVGINVADYLDVIGKELTNDKEKYNFITKDDLK